MKPSPGDPIFPPWRGVINRMMGIVAAPSQLTRIETLAKNILALVSQIQVAGSADFLSLAAQLTTANRKLDEIEQDVNSPSPDTSITPIITLGGRGIVSVTLGKKDEIFMATVIKTGGPLRMDVSGFVDAANNPVTDTDPATYTTSDATVATVANDPANAQDGIITLTGTTTAPGANVVITASFPAQPGGMPFAVTGTLVVIEPAAASATAVISGPGVVPGA